MKTKFFFNLSTRKPLRRLEIIIVAKKSCTALPFSIAKAFTLTRKPRLSGPKSGKANNHVRNVKTVIIIRK